VVVVESSSFPFALPPLGEVLIGRGTEADLALDERAASRRHATLTVAEGQVTITDLGSMNGTYVNGERLEGQRQLLAGDTITIGAAMMILYLPPGAAPSRQFGDAAALRRKLQEELERAHLFDRALSVVALQFPAPVDRDSVGRRVDGGLRSIDATGWLSGTELVAVLPEVEEDDAAETTRRLLAAVNVLGLEARAGFAVYPTSACDGDALLAAARGAARGATSGDVADPDAAARVEIGDRKVVVADPATVGLMDLIRRLARTDLPVLVQGETGVGKENAAYALHWWSGGRAGPSWPSTAPPSPRRWSRASSSAARREPSRVRWPPGRACWSRRWAAPSSSTRSASCPARCSRSCCGCWRPSGPCGWAAHASASWTCAWWPPPTATCARR
jgi:hypothetical protein